MKKIKIIFSFLLLLSIRANSQVVTEWRNGGTGIYNEPDLLKEWPEKGPELLWFNDSLGSGHSSASIAYETIYTTGKEDSMDVLYALNLKGELKWKIPYGRAWNESFPKSRSTPTIDDKKIYVSSGMGDIASIDAISGKIIWSLEAAKKFKAKFNRWGVAESLIIKGDTVYFSPIGEETTVIALNKKTGDIIWKSKSIGDSLAYVSPILVNHNGIEMIISVGSVNIFAVNALNGSILWKFDYLKIKPENMDWDPIINCTTPVYEDGAVYVNSGYNHVGVRLNINEKGNEVELAWVDTILDTHHGGVVKLGNYIYGSNWINNGNGNWCCIEWDTGKLKYETKWENKGSIIANDGMLYCYDEKRGNLALVKADPEKFEPISTFKIPYGKGPHWSHPVIKNGILYVRHGEALMAYNLKVKR